MHELPLPAATDNRIDEAHVFGESPPFDVQDASPNDSASGPASQPKENGPQQPQSIDREIPAIGRADATEPAPLWLRRTDQAVVAALVAIILLLAAFQLTKVGWWRG